MQGAPAEAIVGRAVVVRSVARHCSPGGGGEWIGEKRMNVAGQTRGISRRPALTHLAAWVDVYRWQLLQRAEDDAWGRRRCVEDETMRTTMHGRRHNEEDDRPLSPTTRGHTTRGKFSHRFVHISFVRNPRARPGRPGMAWARWMDEGPNLGKNEEPGTRLDRFSPSE
jgi:hypothetical protein